MAAVETEIKKMRIDFKKQIDELRKIIVTRMIPDKWVNQSVACALLGIKPARLRQIRKHLDKNEKSVGYISWKKGTGRNPKYYVPDIEKYNGEHIIMN